MGNIEFYYWPTPNCWKVAIMLEELGVDYVLRPVNIGNGEQYSTAFTAISPNNRVPALSDDDPPFGGGPYHLFESAAILLYLGEKYGHLVPDDASRRYTCLQWTFWQMAGLGPMAGQAHHFRLYAPERIEYAVSRYTNECHRLYGVLNSRLRGREFLADEYSIADIACLPWIHRHQRQGQDPAEFPDLNDWYERLLDRPAVARGLAVATDLRDDSAFTSEAGRRILFGAGDTEESE